MNFYQYYSIKFNNHSENLFEPSNDNNAVHSIY